MMGLGQVGMASQAEGTQQATAGIASLGVVRAGVGEGNGTALQYSRLENPMDGGAWSAAVHGVTKSWT